MKDSRFVLSVICGTVHVYDIEIELDTAEMKKYRDDGETYLDELAKQIRFNPSKWKYRKIN